MKDLRLDNTGDLIIDDSTNDLEITNDDLILLKQKIQSLLNTNLGELWWAENYGINLAELWVNSDNVGTVVGLIDQYLKESLEGYVSLELLKSSLANRELYIELKITMENNVNIIATIGGEANAS